LRQTAENTVMPRATTPIAKFIYQTLVARYN